MVSAGKLLTERITFTYIDFFSGGGRWGLEGFEPLQLFRCRGRAPPKMSNSDIILLITWFFITAKPRNMYNDETWDETATFLAGLLVFFEEKEMSNRILSNAQWWSWGWSGMSFTSLARVPIQRAGYARLVVYGRSYAVSNEDWLIEIPTYGSTK